MTLTAQWEIWTYTVTKYPISTEQYYESKEVDWGYELTEDDLNFEPRPGFRFLGWKTDLDDEDVVSKGYVVKEDLTIYGIWRNSDIILTYDANGGGFDKVAMLHERDVSIPEEQFPTPTRTGYEFAGWCEDASGGGRIEYPYTASTDTTLYAKWTEDKVTLNLNSNGGVIMRTNGTDEED